MSKTVYLEGRHRRLISREEVNEALANPRTETAAQELARLKSDCSWSTRLKRVLGFNIREQALEESERLDREAGERIARNRPYMR